MKRIVLLLTVVFSTTFSFSQVYFDLNVGYGLPMAADNIILYTANTDIDFSFANTNLSTDDSYSKSVFVSLGSGVNANFTVGYMLEKNFGVELEAGYGWMPKKSVVQKFSISSLSSVSEYTVWSSYFHFDPSLRFSLESRSNLSPYFVVGAVVSVPTIYLTSVDTTFNGNILIEKWRYSGNVALGLKTKVGLNFKLSDNLSFFTEVRAVAMSYAPAKGILYEATLNGENRLDDLTTSEKEVVFQKELNNPPSGDADPTYYLRDSYPFSSFGLNLGIRLEL